MNLFDAKIPYIVKSRELFVLGRKYKQGDIAELNPNIFAHINVIREPKLVERYDLNKCELICNSNYLNISDKEYMVGDIIKEKIEDIELLLQRGLIIAKPVINEEKEKVRFCDIAKELGINAKELFEKLSKTEAKTIIGEKISPLKSFETEDYNKIKTAYMGA